MGRAAGARAARAASTRRTRNGWPGTGTWPSTAGPVSAGRRSTAAGRCSLTQQAIFHEEYARADAPGTVNHLGEQLLGPTLIEFGTDEQKARFLPGIKAVDELWCQGYSEPGAGSDLAACAPRRRLDEAMASGSSTARRCGPRWPTRPTGASSSPAPSRDRRGTTGSRSCWCRCDQDGVEIRPDRADHRRRGVQRGLLLRRAHRRRIRRRCTRRRAGGSPWPCSASSAGSRRSASRSASSASSSGIVDLARSNGAIDDPVIRDRLAAQRVGLEVMRLQRPAHADRGDARVPATSRLQAGLGRTGTATSASSPWRSAAPASLTAEPASRVRPRRWQRLFLFTRADTIYGGSNEIQRNIIAERVLGLPREARG